MPQMQDTQVRLDQKELHSEVTGVPKYQAIISSMWLQTPWFRISLAVSEICKYLEKKNPTAPYMNTSLKKTGESSIENLFLYFNLQIKSFYNGYSAG